MIFTIKSRDSVICVGFSPEEHKAFHRDAFLFNLSNQGTTQWVIEQLSKEDANPSNFSPQHIKNLAKTIEQNKATGQYLSTNANIKPNIKSHSQWNDNDESDHNIQKDKKKFKSNDCTQCGDYRHKEGFRCPASWYKCKICSKTRHFPKMCFFKDQK